MNPENKEASKLWKLATYIATFLAGFITNFSGVLDNITKIPSSYHNFKETYLYDKDFLSGSWSTNAEYVINQKEAGLDKEQPNIILKIEVDNDGGVDGGILSQKICDALPITWRISFESESPNFKNIFVKRSFFIKQLHNGEMEEVAELKMVNENKKHRTITLKTISDRTGSLPEFLTFGKELPSYKEDYDQLNAYCAESPKRFRDALRKNSVGSQKH